MQPSLIHAGKKSANGSPPSAKSTIESQNKWRTEMSQLTEHSFPQQSVPAPRTPSPKLFRQASQLDDPFSLAGKPLTEKGERTATEPGQVSTDAHTTPVIFAADPRLEAEITEEEMNSYLSVTPYSSPPSTPKAPLKTVERSVYQPETNRSSPTLEESPSVAASARRQQKLSARKEAGKQVDLGLGLPLTVAEGLGSSAKRIESEARKRRRAVEDVSGEEGGAGTTVKTQPTPLDDARMISPLKKQAARAKRGKQSAPKRQSLRIQNKREAKKKQGERAAAAAAGDESSTYIIIGNGAPPSYQPVLDSTPTHAETVNGEERDEPYELMWQQPATTESFPQPAPRAAPQAKLTGLRFLKNRAPPALHPSAMGTRTFTDPKAPGHASANPLDDTPNAHSTPTTLASNTTTTGKTAGHEDETATEIREDTGIGEQRDAQSLDYDENPNWRQEEMAEMASVREVISVHDSDEEQSQYPESEYPEDDHIVLIADSDDDVVMLDPADAPLPEPPARGNPHAQGAVEAPRGQHTGLGGPSRAALMRAAAQVVVPPPEVVHVAFPEINVYNFSSLHENQCPVQMQKWLDKVEEEEKILLCTVAGRGVDDYGAFDVNTAVNRIIRHELASPTPRAVAATASTDPDKPNSPPFWYQVQDLSRPQFLRLKEKRGIYADGFYLGFVAWSPVPTKLLGAWHKCHRMVDLSVDHVIGEFRKAFLESEEANVARHLIRTDLGGGNTAAVRAQVEEIFDDTVKSINARVLKSKNKDQVTHPIVVYYMDPPTQDAVAWEALRKRIRTNIRPGDQNAGRLEYYKDAEVWRCRSCHGADHPSGFCLVPEIKGWKEPTAVVTAFKDEQSARESKEKRNEAKTQTMEMRAKGAKRQRETKPQSGAKGRKARGG